MEHMMDVDPTEAVRAQWDAAAAGWDAQAQVLGAWLAARPAR